MRSRAAAAVALSAGLLPQCGGGPIGERRLPARRKLFGWPVDPGSISEDLSQVIDDSDLAQVIDDSAEFVAETSEELQSQVSATWLDAAAALEGALGLTERLQREVQSLLGQAMSFRDKMESIYVKFQPLEEVFAASHGVVALLTSKERLAVLVGVVEDLLTCSSDLLSISEASAAVETALSELSGVLQEKLSDVAEGTRPVGDSRRLLDLSGALDGFDFAAWSDAFASLSQTASEVTDSLAQIKAVLSPLLEKLPSVLGGRRLAGSQLDGERGAVRDDYRHLIRLWGTGIEQVKTDFSEYYGAVMSVVPAWVSLEALAVDSCVQCYNLVGQVQDLMCRLGELVKLPAVPGLGIVDDLVATCEGQAAGHEDAGSACPTTLFSAEVKDNFSRSAAFIGVACVALEYFFTYNDLVRATVSVVLFVLPGILFGVVGYRYKDVEFWIEGFLAGVVLFSSLISVFIVWCGVCRDAYVTHCDMRLISLVVVILSAIWAFVVNKVQSCQLFFAGFDLGCLLGGLSYLAEEFDKIRDSVLDDELAKKEMIMMLTWAILWGLVLGAVTLYFQKFAIVLGTSAIGAVLVLLGFALLGVASIDFSLYLASALALTAVFVAVQYRFTSPPEAPAQYSIQE